jgi:hypothetical protein
MMIIAVGSGQQISGLLPRLGGLLPRPVVTLECVRVCNRDGPAAVDTEPAAIH